MIVSVTEIGSYKRCRRQWMINSRNRWALTRMVPSRPLGLGTLVHAALGDWLTLYKADESIPDGGLGTLFLGHTRDTIDSIKATYERQNGSPMTEDKLAPIMETVNMGYAMMLNYQKRWGKPVPDDFDVIQTEQRVIVPIPGTEHTEEWVWVPAVSAPEQAGYGTALVTPPTALMAPHGWMQLVKYKETHYHYLEGRLDAILRNRKNGRLYTLEHKTYGQRPREDTLFAMDQFLGYHWMLIQLAAEMGLDPRDVAGVAYDGLWKRAAPPKTVDGHMGVLNDLFCRRLITRPQQEIVEYERMLAALVTEMANAPAIYHNRTSDGSCFWMCSDNALCLAMSRGEDVEHFLRQDYKPKPADYEDEKPREF